MRWLLTLIALIISVLWMHLSAQRKLEKSVSGRMDAIRKGEVVFEKELTLKPAKENSMLNFYKEYLLDTFPECRYYALSGIFKLAVNSKNVNTRHEAVNTIVSVLSDENSGVNGAAIRYLCQFTIDDFNEEALNSIIEKRGKIKANLDAYLMLCCFLNLPVVVDYYKPEVLSGRDAKLRKACFLSLARMGYETICNYYINKVKELPLNDDLVYDVLPDLIYIRQRESILYVMELLQDDSPVCSSETGEAITCGYRIMELLAPVIKNFPVQVTAGGDVAVSDYVATLRMVREWCKQNEQQIVIRRDFY